jgi:hypothetical protein
MHDYIEEGAASGVDGTPGIFEVKELTPFLSVFSEPSLQPSSSALRYLCAAV